MVMERDAIKSEYPLHWLVWHNDYRELDNVLEKDLHDKQKKDVRGRTPLMLAVTLGHVEVTRVLLRHEASVNTENNGGWTVVQEAVATGDPELLQVVLERRDYERYSSRNGGIPELLQRLKDAPDFYVEMKWEFTSWVPLVSRMCPSDTYKVYKSGSNVRIDTTLLGFDQTSWKRGNRSYIFKGHNGEMATMMEIDHDTQQLYMEQVHLMAPESLNYLPPCGDVIAHRLTTPIVTTYLDTEKIEFERNRSGIWGWRSDKVETVNCHDCKVFGATNVELVTKTRTEHLTDADKTKTKVPKTPFQSFLGIAEMEQKQVVPNTNGEEMVCVGNPSNIQPEEYFSRAELGGRDIGRPKEVSTKIQKFKATLWLCEDYPLSLQEQIMPVVDLMAISSTHFAKLKDFIQLQLPAGFPVKIEIPLFHILNARITFGNIFGMDAAVTGVTYIREEDRMSCILGDTCFESPPGYSVLGAELRHQFSMDENDELLQFAIQQSLIEEGSEREEVDIWEALRAQRPSRPTTPSLQNEEDTQLQRAIQESLAVYQNPDSCTEMTPESRLVSVAVDPDLEMAMALSQKEKEAEERRRQEEEETLDRILKLSLTEK